MKFVFNQEKNDHARKLLMMQPKVEEAKAALEKDDTDAYAWYVYGKALSLEKRYEEAIEAHSRGIAFDPFYAPNYFGRGGKYSSTGRLWSALADYTMAIHLDCSNWLYWYYRATTLNLAGHLEESIDDFRQCMKVSDPTEHYPLAHWIYSTYVEMGQYEKAEKSLEEVDATVTPPQMDYGYCRTVRLSKGMVKPEEFIEPDMKDKVLPREKRVELEQNTMYYGLYCYWMVHGEPEKATEAIKKLLKIAYPGAFGYTKSIPVARRLGLME